MASLTNLGIIPYDNNRQGLYVTLDSIYDTKLACLEELNVEIALHAIRNSWSERIFDTVPGFPDEEYKKLYDNRDARTLMIAHPTPIIDFMTSWIKQIEDTIASNPFGGFVEVFVNVWPYKLPRSVAKRIVSKVAELLDTDASVTMLNIDPVELSALDAKRYFSAMIDVDYHRWLDTRAATDLRVCPLADVTLYVPKIFKGTVNDAQRNALADVDVFVQAENMLAPMIGIEFLELELFSSPVTADMLSDKPLADVTT